MIKYFILDDDINIVKMLSNIIESDFNRSLVGTSCDAKEAVYEIRNLKPDVVIIDYLMPKLDGAEVIKEVNEAISYVMISQVSDKGMISQAYKSGISFFISKPINRIEVNSVLSHVESEINNKRKLKQIITALDFSEERREDNFGEKIEASLRELGLLGEKATKDIIEICKMKHKDYRAEFADIIFEYSKQVNETPKIIKQRIRRSVKSGLSNLASLGIEDYMNEIFVKYSNSVYNFQSVKHEMDFIRNKQSTSGKCNTNKFLESLIYINQIK